MFTINVENEFAKDLDEAITGEGKKPAIMITETISHSEARTNLSMVYEQNDSWLQNAKTNKSDKTNPNANDKIMLANYNNRLAEYTYNVITKKTTNCRTELE